VGTGVVLAIFALARVGAHYLTRPLRELETVTRSVIQSGSLEHRFAARGVFEIEQLGISFNQMLEQLDGAHRQLQHQAEAEAERNQALAEANTALAQEIGERERAEVTLAQTVEDLRVAERRQRELLAVTRREQGRLRALLAAMSVGVLFEDNRQCVQYLNPAFLRIWGIDEALDLVGHPMREILEHSTHRFARPDHASRYVLQVLDTHEISERCEIDLYDGRILTQMSYPVMDNERLLGRLWLYEDITHERQTAQQLLYLAERDPLTGLYNRHSFQKRLEQKIAAALRTGDPFAVIYFDLDEFKAINDTFGHRAGDLALVRTASEIAAEVRATEMFARLGGDEFAILSTLGAGHESDAFPARIVETVSAIPFRFRGTNLRLTTSVGLALFPEHGENMEDLVAHADAAMYQAKNQGKNTWAIYDPSRDSTEVMMRRLNWHSRITQALEGQLFELYFQGVYHIKNRVLSHLEVLIRMRNPEDPEHPILPGQFITLAEKSGQVLDIDRWVLQQSITLLGRSTDLPPLAVNISGRTFDDPALPRNIQRLLTEHGVDPQRLLIELTETAAVSDVQDAQRFIEAIQQVGCGVCLDDFGSGFSTFVYLKYLNVKILKIDGLFIRDLSNHYDNQVFIRAMVEVARGLRKTTVAEFVEDAATLNMLRDLGVDLVQGYHLDRPMAEHPALGCLAG
jgi:diguanylate cyclase (GGDEF)-like protein